MVAAVLYFVLMVPMKTLKNRFGTAKAAEPTEIELLIEIRDLLAKRQADSIVDAESFGKDGSLVEDPRAKDGAIR